MNDRAIAQLYADGATTVDDVVAECGAGGRCGGCRPTIEALLDEHLAAGTPVNLTPSATPERVASAA